MIEIEIEIAEESRAAVDDTAADGDDVGIALKGLAGARQPIGGRRDIGVQKREDVARGGFDPHVAGAAGIAPDLCAQHPRSRLSCGLRARVGRGVVHDEDFERRFGLRQRGAHRVGHDPFSVAARNDDGDAHAFWIVRSPGSRAPALSGP